MDRLGVNYIFRSKELSMPTPSGNRIKSAGSDYGSDSDDNMARADQGREEKKVEKAMAGGSSAAAAAADMAAGSSSPAMAGGKKKKKTRRKVRMTQEEIDSYINYRTIRMPDGMYPKISKERLACTDLADKGDLPVPMDQIDDYVAKIFRRINQIESGFMKHRDGILNQYYRKGYAERYATDDDDDDEEEEETSPADAQGEEEEEKEETLTDPAGDEQARAPHPGRRRFRPGVSIKAGKINKLN